VCVWLLIIEHLMGVCCLWENSTVISCGNVWACTYFYLDIGLLASYIYRIYTCVCMCVVYIGEHLYMLYEVSLFIIWR
jgi:hypothetical protein